MKILKDKSSGITAAAKYSMRVGGKRIRPILAIATAEGFGKKFKDIRVYCRALEMIHTYSLMHDDLPAMDDDVLRRGKPTAHTKYGANTAFLGGIFLLKEAFNNLFVEIQRDPSNAGKKNAALTLAHSSGINGMIGGQMADMSAAGINVDSATLHYIHTHKTGALVSASIYGAALWLNMPPGLQKKLLTAGRKIGLAFQIVDDILDIEQSSKTLGKTSGKDSIQGKATYPALHGMTQAKARAIELKNDVHRMFKRGKKHRFQRLADLSSYIVNRVN